MFKGIYTALITPFKGGKVDVAAFEALVDWQIIEGIHGLVPCGTTGESPTLSHDEHKHVVELCIKAAKGRVPVIAGTGSNSTDEAIMMTNHAKQAGADGALVVTPYYNKPAQEGLYQHYKAINDACQFPIIIYNIPGRSVVNISDDTLARLAELPFITGVKDATGDLARPYTLRAKAKKTLELFSGEDMTAVAFNAAGGHGCISVSSNVMPKLCAQVQEACKAGDYAKAASLHETMVPLHSVLFCETSPAPVKFALSLMKKCTNELRLPLVEPHADNKNQITQVLKKLHLL